MSANYQHIICDKTRQLFVRRYPPAKLPNKEHIESGKNVSGVAVLNNELYMLHAPSPKQAKCLTEDHLHCSVVMEISNYKY